MPKADKRARRLLLGIKNKDIHITVICGGQSEDIAGYFRKAKFRYVKAFKGGYFDKWLQSSRAERPRKPI